MAGNTLDIRAATSASLWASGSATLRGDGGTTILGATVQINRNGAPAATVGSTTSPAATGTSLKVVTGSSTVLIGISRRVTISSVAPVQVYRRAALTGRETHVYTSIMPVETSTSGEGTLPVLPCACANLRRTARAVTRCTPELRATGLEVTQFTLLMTLQVTGETTQGGLGKLLALDTTSLTRMLRP